MQYLFVVLFALSIILSRCPYIPFIHKPILLLKSAVSFLILHLDILFYLTTGQTANQPLTSSCFSFFYPTYFYFYYFGYLLFIISLNFFLLKIVLSTKLLFPCPLLLAAILQYFLAHVILWSFELIKLYSYIIVTWSFIILIHYFIRQVL